MAVIAENQPISRKNHSRVGAVARHVLLSATLAATGATISRTGAENIPGIEQAIGVDNDILDTLQVAAQATSGESSERIGSRTFPNGFSRPNMRLVEGNLKVASMLIDIKGGSEQIKVDLGRAIAMAPQVGNKQGDTAEIQGIIARSAEKFDSEVDALTGRRKLNFAAKFGGGLVVAAYPVAVIGSWILGKRRRNSNAEDSSGVVDDGEVRNSTQAKISNDEGEIDERKPFWIADKMNRDGTLLPRPGNQ